MSIEKITYWGFVVPKYKKDKSSYRNTSSEWNDEVFVVITTTLRNSHMGALNLS